MLHLLVLIFYFSTNTLFADNYKFGIKNFCNQITIDNLLKDKIKINYIEIKIDNFRKWNIYNIRAITRNDP